MPGLGRRMRGVVLGTIASPSFAALSAGDPGDAAATIVEPTIGANGYARQSVTWAAVSTPASGAPAILTNSNQLTFTSAGPWHTTVAISHVPVFAAASGIAESGFLGTCVLKPARLVDRAGIVIVIPAGALELTIGLKE